MPSIGKYTSRTVTADLSIGQAKIAVNGFTLRHTIDELPYAEISVQLDNKDVIDENIQGSVNINVATFRKMSTLFQEKILNEFRLEPNVVFVVKDGNNDDAFTLTFKGFLGKPEVIIQEGQISIKLGMVHAKAALQAWNGQVYNYVEPYAMPHFENAFGSSAPTDAQAAGKGSSVSMKVLALAKYMMKAVGMVPDLSDKNEFDMLPIHLLNQKSFYLVEEVLKASATSTEIEGLEDGDLDTSNLYEVLFEMLRNSPNFWGVLQQLGQTFLFQTNADWSGNLWMEPIQSIKAGPGDRVIRVPLAQVRFNMAHLFELPLQQVIIVGEGMDLYVFSGAMGLNQGESPLAPIVMPGGAYYSGRVPKDGEIWVKMQGLARYPVETDRNLVGNFYVLNAPFWINSDVMRESMLKQYEGGLTATDGRWVQSVDAQPELHKEFMKASNPRKKLLAYMAEQLFNSLYLGSTYAAITVPFDLRPCVGRIYRVQDLDGEAIFDGFLKSIVHSVDMNADGGAHASTSMVFTHIVVAGANLKQLAKTSTPGVTSIPDADWLDKI